MFTQADYPCNDQDEQSTKQWMTTNAEPGLVVVVRHTQAGMWEYHLDEIIRVNDPTKGRIYLHSGTFYFSGKHCFHPKGQTQMLIPTDAVLKAAVDGHMWVHAELATRPLSDRERSLAERMKADKGW